MKMTAFLVDVDGTIALRDESVPGCRGPFDWDRVHEDKPNQPVIEVVRALAVTRHLVIYLSGRSNACYRSTLTWIDRHVGVPGDGLFMRDEGDYRPDDVVKRELYEMHVEPYCDVVAVLDDRDKVVRMWRDLGLTVLQVAEGAF